MITRSVIGAATFCKESLTAPSCRSCSRIEFSINDQVIQPLLLLQTKLFTGFLYLRLTWKNRPFSYSTKEPGSSDIFIQIYTRGSKEWRYSFDRNCAHSKTLQIVMKYRSLHIRFQNSYKVYYSTSQQF